MVHPFSILNLDNCSICVISLSFIANDHIFGDSLLKRFKVFLDYGPVLLGEITQPADLINGEDSKKDPCPY